MMKNGTTISVPKPPRVTIKSQLEASAKELPSIVNYRCQQCGLCTESPGRVFWEPRDITSLKWRILIVGSALHEWDNEAPLAFSGPAEQLFKSLVLKPLGLLPAEVSFGYVARCYAPDGKPTGVQLSLCGAFLQQDIQRLRPSLVVCLGLEAAKAILQQKDIKLKDYIGKKIQLNGANILVTYSPRMVLAKKNIGYMASIKRAMEFVLSNRQPLPFPEMKEV